MIKLGLIPSYYNCLYIWNMVFTFTDRAYIYDNSNQGNNISLRRIIEHFADNISVPNFGIEVNQGSNNVHIIWVLINNGMPVERKATWEEI